MKYLLIWNEFKRWTRQFFWVFPPTKRCFWHHVFLSKSSLVWLDSILNMWLLVHTRMSYFTQQSCSAQRNATCILMCTIFDKLWRQRKKAAYWPNYFVCTKTKFLNGDQVTQDYLPGLSRIWILNNYSITEFLTFLNHEFNLFQNLLQAETGWWSRPGSNWHDHQLHWTDSTNWKQLKMGLNNEINKFRKKWIFFEVIMQGFIFES